MAGHSQYKNIMYRKEAQDSKKAAIFNKIAREILLSVKNGKSIDPNINSRLRSAIATARMANMPRDNINRLLKKISESKETNNLEESRFEAYGPFGSAFILDVITDNKNRTISDIRVFFNKNGGSLVESGNVKFLFENCAVIKIKKDLICSDDLFEIAVNSEVNNIDEEEECYKLTISKSFLNIFQDLLSKKIDSSKILINFFLKPVDIINYSINSDEGFRLKKILSSLEENEYIQYIFTNFNLI